MLRKLIRRLPDPLLAFLSAVRRRVRPTSADIERVKRDAIDRRLGHPSEVAQGPFRGMRLQRWFGGRWLRQLLGTYEREIWPAVEELCALDPQLIVNIGAANGYYSVGLALRLPRARVIAFEGDAVLKRVLRRTARANGVAERVHARGWCDPAKLRQALASPVQRAVVCDADGGEDVLLDPERVPELTVIPILVELHDHLCAGVSDRIRARFQPTHRIREFTIGQRSVGDLPAQCPLEEVDALFAMDEYRQIRGARVWWMVPGRADGAAGSRSGGT
jgi:hypothetical protein